MFPRRVCCLLALAASLPVGSRAADPLPDGAVVRFRRSGPTYSTNHSPLAVSPAGEFLPAHNVVSPDGKLRALISDAHVIRLISSDPEREGRVLEGHTAYVAAVAFSADGKVLGSGSNDRTLRLWDLATGKALHVCAGHDDQVCAVAFAPDGKTVASGSWDGSVRLWDVATGKELRRWAGHRYEVLGVAFAPDGKTVASGGTDGTVRFWDVAGGQEIRRFTVHESGVLALAFTKDGTGIVTADGQRQLRLWDAGSGKAVRSFDSASMERAYADSVLCGAVAADGQTVALGYVDGTVCLYEAATGKQLRVVGRHPGHVWSVAFAPDGKTLASSARRHGVVRLWDVATGQMVRSYAGHMGGVSGVLFSADGKTLIAAGGSFEPVIIVYDTATAKPVRRLEGHTDYVSGIALAPDGKWLASAATDRTLRLWDLATGKERRSFPGPEAHHTPLAFTADGTGLLAPDADGAVCLCDVAGGRPRRRYPALTQFLAESPAGHTLAGMTDDNFLALVEATTGQERRRFPSPGSAGWAAFAPDGRRLLVDGGDATALLWDLTGSAQAGLAAAEHDVVWRDLAGEAGRAYDAVWKLAQAPREGVALLGERLRPAAPVADIPVARRVAELDDEDFAVREKATRDLAAAGEAARAALEKALAESPSAEVRRRAGGLLLRLDEGAPGPEELRRLRALEALAQIGTPEARQVVERLAKGAPSSKTTQEAKALLLRWPAR
jgi:WD40 repeat protein